MRPRRLWHLLLGHPRLWALLIGWTALVLAFFLVQLLLMRGEGVALHLSQTALAISALAALALAGLIIVHAYLSVREIRRHLFGGDYEEAYEVARRHAGVVLGIDFESALRRLLEFDRRRAEKVAGTTRLVGRLLRETDLLILLGDLDEGQVRFSIALCQLLGVNDNRFSIDSLLRQPDNEGFAQLWHDVTGGEKSSVEDTVTLHLPVRQIARQLHLRLLAVQDDAGAIAYVLGFADQAESDSPPALEAAESAQL